MIEIESLDSEDWHNIVDFSNRTIEENALFTIKDFNSVEFFGVVEGEKQQTLHLHFEPCLKEEKGCAPIAEVT